MSVRLHPLTTAEGLNSAAPASQASMVPVQQQQNQNSNGDGQVYARRTHAKSPIKVPGSNLEPPYTTPPPNGIGNGADEVLDDELGSDFDSSLVLEMDANGD